MRDWVYVEPTNTDQMACASKLCQRTALNDLGMGFAFLAEDRFDFGTRHAIRGSNVAKERFNSLHRDAAVLVFISYGEHVLFASGWQFVDVAVCRSFVL